jgi:hypothetical protein
MPRRLPKRPVHAVKAAWPKITRTQWAAIGKAYERPIRAPVRQAIDNSLREYAALERAESGGVSTGAVDTQLADIREHAKALLAALTAEGDTALAAHDLIEQAFAVEEPLPESFIHVPGYGSFRVCARIGFGPDQLRGLLIVLEHAYDRLPDLRPHQKGDDWDAWVRGLTVICEQHDLPTEVRQDLGRQRRSSPFVVFVESLQKALPPHLQRHTHSRGALTSAINKTRMRTE